MPLTTYSSCFSSVTFSIFLADRFYEPISRYETINDKVIKALQNSSDIQACNVKKSCLNTD